MSKRSSFVRWGVVTALASLTAAALVAGSQAAETAPAVKKPKARPAATATAKPAPAPKPAKPAKPPRPPEKSYDEQFAQDGLWTKRTSWLSFRAGYAKGTGDFAGDGLVGYGIAYQRMIGGGWSVGGAVQHDLLGHLGTSYEISVPFTLELARHFRWQTVMRPYVGIGGGYYFHKYYRTPGDYTGSPGAGMYVNFGTNLPVAPRNLLGIDTRVSFMQTTEGAVNPVFGEQKSSETLWSVKLNWAFAYH